MMRINLVLLVLFGISSVGFAQSPSIVSISPYQNELNIPVNANIEVAFDMDMDETTFNGTNIFVYGEFTGYHWGDYSYDELSRLLTIDPENDFSVGEVVTVTLTTGIQSSAGVPMDSSRVWQFTCEVHGGTGNFAFGETYHVSGTPQSIVAADMDGDLDIDLVCIDAQYDSAFVYFNNGSGMFTYFTKLYTHLPDYVCAGDFNFDGLGDFAVSSTDDNNVKVFCNQGDSTFVQTEGIALGGHGTANINCADFTSNGKLDFVIPNARTGSVLSRVTNVSSWGGDCSYSSVTNWYGAGEGGSPSIACSADMDNDWDIDVTVSNTHIPPSVATMYNSGNGNFTYEMPLCEAYTYIHAQTVGDFNSDSYPDMAVGHRPDFGGPPWVTIMINDGSGHCSDTLVIDTGHYSGRYGMSNADFDADGDLDIASVNEFDPSVSIMENSGNADFTVTQTLEYAGNFSICDGDFDNDGDIDLAACGYNSGDGIRILFNELKPRVISTIPTQNALNIPVDANIEVTFDLDMDESTLDGTNVFVYGELTGYHLGSFSYNNTNRTLILDPEYDFAVGEVVTVSLTTGMLSSQGDPLDSSRVWSFTCEVHGGPGIFKLGETYLVGGAPQKVVAADIDGDLDVDLICCDWRIDSVVVLYNNGEGVFPLRKTFSTIFDPQYVCAGDFNFDGYIDIATLHSTDQSVAILCNNGDSTFSSYDRYDLNGSVNPHGIKFADIKGNGKLDLLIATNRQAEGHVSYMINIADWGEGCSFYPYVFWTEAGDGHAPMLAYSADMDNDYDMDIAVVNSYNPSVTVLFNSGAGGFTYVGPRCDTYENSRNLVVADFDGDSFMDMAMGHKEPSHRVSVFKNNGYGGCYDLAYIMVEEGPNGIIAADFNNDNDLDLATINENGINVSILDNNGSGDFTVIQTVGRVGNFSICYADFDNDGDVDIAVSGYTNNSGVRIILNEADPKILSTSPSHNELNVPVNANIEVTFDLDMDEATFTSSTFVVHSNLTGLYYGAFSYDNPTRTVTIDLDSDFAAGEVVTVILTDGIESNDGVPMESGYSWSFTALAEPSEGLFSHASTNPVGDNPRSIYAADVNGDGNIDLVTTNMGSNDISVLLNNGDGTFAEQLTYSTNTTWGASSVFAADFDADNDLDLITGNPYDNNLTLLINNGDGIFEPEILPLEVMEPSSVFSADVDGDANFDIVTTNLKSGGNDSIMVLTNQGNAIFTEYQSYLAGSFPVGVFAADLNNDGDCDIAVADSFNLGITILPNIGDGVFGDTDDYPGHANSTIVVACLNDDNLLDIATTDWATNEVSIMINSGDGTFSESSSYAIGQGGHSICVGDIDGDGDLDIIITNWASNNISILRNDGNGLFEPAIYYNAGDAPSSVCAADLDGDGDLELAVTNWDDNNVSVLLNGITPNSISGLKFNDENDDGIFNPEEQAIAGWRIMLDRFGEYPLQIQETDQDGVYGFEGLEPGTYVVSEIGRSYWEQTVPSIPPYYGVTLEEGGYFTDLDFGNRQLIGIQDLCVQTSSFNARPGYQTLYGVQPRNKGTIDIEATVTIDLPLEVVYVDCYSDGFYDPGSHSVTWGPILLEAGDYYCNLGAGDCLWGLQVVIYVPPSVPVGTVLSSLTMIEPVDGDVNPNDNSYIYDIEVTGSLDPNVKSVNPEGCVSATTSLRYHIDFQNVGNDTAFKVVIVDTLDNNLDISTVMTGTSLHSYNMSISGRELTWTFEDINLPDSIADEPGSHGFIEYIVAPMADIQIGDIIMNWASIYFDFNDPVITDTVINTIGFNYLPGDVNMYNGVWPPHAIGGDVTYLVNYFRSIPSSQACLMHNPTAVIAPVYFWASADANGDCLVIGSDVTRLVNYFRGLTELSHCPDYPPAWLTPDDLPGEAPAGWPNCEE
ncbi:MAG: hypothetical protein GY839_10210 [candidate division Zixibacteria bacterium]|nr:hypothetical protein [candidate division Zixibacteria bacterium]